MGNSVVHILPTGISLPELPEAFCKFFSDKIKDIRCKLDSCPIDSDFFPFDGIPLTCFRPVSEETVRDLVLISPTKSCALDPIPTGLLKACIDSLVPFITRIVQQRLNGNGLLETCQPAYRKEHSTETALLAVTDTLLSNTDNRLASIVAFLDLCCV